MLGALCFALANGVGWLFAGIGAGPLLSGALAQYAADPHVGPYLVEIALHVLAGLAIAGLLDPVAPSRWRPRRPQVPPAIRGPFIASGTLAFLARSPACS